MNSAATRGRDPAATHWPPRTSPRTRGTNSHQARSCRRIWGSSSIREGRRIPPDAEPGPRELNPRAPLTRVPIDATTAASPRPSGAARCRRSGRPLWTRGGWCYGLARVVDRSDGSGPRRRRTGMNLRTRGFGRLEPRRLHPGLATSGRAAPDQGPQHRRGRARERHGVPGRTVTDPEALNKDETGWREM